MYTISGNEHIHSFWIILLASSSVALRMVAAFWLHVAQLQYVSQRHVVSGVHGT